MALIQMNYVSAALQRAVPVQVILPVDKFGFDGKLPPKKKFKTLYLLHGYLGNCTDWVSGTRIQRWAEERDLCVVMPSGDNAFYVDRPATGNCYGEFIGRELVEVTRRMFPLSSKREDTFIGGLSMGGFGAMRNGLKYHDTFGAIISFSGVLELFRNWGEAPGNLDFSFQEGLFGDYDSAAESDKNPIWLAKKLAGKKNLPDIYIACGVDDMLLSQSRNFRDLLVENGYRVTYEEGPGAHEWDFWDTYIKKVLDWLPLDASAKGINSGNVTP